MTPFAEALLNAVAAHLAAGQRKVAIVGLTADGLAVAARAQALGADIALFDPEDTKPVAAMQAWSALPAYEADVIVIAADADKPRLLRAAAEALDGASRLPHVVLSGIAHQDVHDSTFEELESPALVPSYATGHPHTRVHLYNCLRAAAVHDRTGAIVELGAFKGGTSVWLAKAVRTLGLKDVSVIAFDSWDGFPPRRSLLDLYEHERCEFRDFDAVRAYTRPYGIELVKGDIKETAPRRLAHQPVLLAFVDTDNYSGTRAALKVIVQNLVSGGAIVLDHYWTTEDYAYTIGERMAANEVLMDAGLLHLHGTGVFVKC